MSKHLKTFLRVIFFLAIGLGILYLIYRGQNAKYVEDCDIRGIAPEDCSLVVKVWQDFLSVEVYWLIAVLVAFMFANLSRAHRWMLLFRGMGLHARFSTSFFTIMFGYMANLGIPRIGEVLRGAMLARHEGIPVSKVIGTVVVDRIMDLLTLVAMICIALIFEFSAVYGFVSENLNMGTVAGRVVLPGIAVIVIGGIVIYLVRQRLKKVPIILKFKSAILGFIEGIKSLRTVKNPALFLLHTLFIWLMYFLMNYWCLKAYAPTADLTATAALIVFVFGALGIVFPTPAGMGTYHAMIIAGLLIYGISSEDAFSFANILYFSVQIFCNVLFGLIALLALPLIPRRQQT